MNKIFKLIAITPILIHIPFTYASPQQKYRNETEIAGAAYFNSIVLEKRVIGLLNFCSKKHKAFESAKAKALLDWNERNKKFLVLVDSLREDFQEAAKNAGAENEVKEFEASLEENMITSYVDAFETVHRSGNAKVQVELCERLAEVVSDGKYDIAGDDEIKRFLEQRLLDEAAPNLSIEIDFPSLAGAAPTPLEAKTLEAIELVGKYNTTSKIIEKDGKRLNLIRIDFVNHFSRKEGLPLLDQLFGALNTNLSENIVFRVKLKTGGSDKSLMRLTPQK